MKSKMFTKIIYSLPLLAVCAVSTPAFAADVESCVIMESQNYPITKFASHTVVFTGKEDKDHESQVIDLKLMPSLQIKIKSSVSESLGTYSVSAYVLETDAVYPIVSSHSVSNLKADGTIPINALGLNYQYNDHYAVNVNCAVEAQ